LGEVNTAVSALTFVRDELPEGALGPQQVEDVTQVARVVTDLRDLMEGVAPAQEAAPSATEPRTILDIPNRLDATVVLSSLRLAAEFHKDSLVRQSATDMLRTYEEAGFNASMAGDAPANIPPAEA